MRLVVQSANVADLEACKSIYGAATGDLSAPLIQSTWPVEANDTASAKHRVEWSFQQQIAFIEKDPTTRMVKVVDADSNDEIVALGRWHRYTNGFEQVGDFEAVGLLDRNDPNTWPDGVSKEFYLGLIDPLVAERPSWIGPGHFWVLTTVATREPLRRHGAGSLILEWGLQQAAKEGVPAYLESVAAAKGLYEKRGFRVVGEQVFDCTPFGMPGVEFTIARMRADPK